MSATDRERLVEASREMSKAAEKLVRASAELGQAFRDAKERDRERVAVLKAQRVASGKTSMPFGH